MRQQALISTPNPVANFFQGRQLYTPWISRAAEPDFGKFIEALTLCYATRTVVGPSESRCRSSVTSADSWPGSSQLSVTKWCNKGRKAPCRCELTKDERSVPRFIQDWLAAAGKSWNQSPTPLGCARIGLWCKDLESHNTPFVFLITFVICCDFVEVFAVSTGHTCPLDGLF